MPSDNDRTPRDRHWRRFAGDAWAAFDTLPPVIRGRLAAHAERAMLRALDHHERPERVLFAAEYRARHGAAFPHDAAAAAVLRVP